MSKKLQSIIHLFLILALFPSVGLHAQAGSPSGGPADSAASAAHSILVLPVRQVVPDEQFAYLRSMIARLLVLNLEGKTDLSVADVNGVEAFIAADYASQQALMASIKDLDSFLSTEYFVRKGRLFLTSTMVEAGTGRARGSWTRSLTTDLDMIRGLEAMAKEVSEGVAASMPRFSRDEVLSRQAEDDIRAQLEAEEALIARFTERSSHEFTLLPLTGLSTGRGMASWTAAGPLVCPPLALSWVRRNKEGWHIGAGAEWLPFDLMRPSFARSELTAEVLAGGQTASLVSLGWDAGLSLSWSRNDASGALAYEDSGVPAYPAVERLSLGIPLGAGITLYDGSVWFSRIRLRYHGLSWTIEPQALGSYALGERLLRYREGISPWSLAAFSLDYSVGFWL